MPTTQPKAGVVVVTNTTGSAPYSISGPVDGWRDFVAADDGKTYPYGCYQDGEGFEEGEGTYDHDARTLTRTTILSNHLNTTDPVEWGDGDKELSIVIPAARAVLTSVANRFLEPQYFGGNPIYFDIDEDSWIGSPDDDELAIYLAAVETLRLTGGLSELKLTAFEDGATQGPVITAMRRSATPAINDVGGVFRGIMLDAGGNEVTTLRLRSYFATVTSGAANSIVDIAVSKAGSPQVVLDMRPDIVRVPTGVHFYTGNKLAQNVNVVGAEFRDSGVVVAVAQDLTPIHCYRKGSDGNLIAFGKDGTFINAINLSAGDIQYLGFTGVHQAEWADPVGGEAFERRGTVVAFADGTVPVRSGGMDRLRIRPAQGPRDRRVYGAIANRQPATRDQPSWLNVAAVGDGLVRVTGEVRAGRFLWASSTPGVAEQVPDDAPATMEILSCILGRASQDSPDDGGERLCPVVFSAG